jgi:hypothetical protein
MSFAYGQSVPFKTAPKFVEEAVGIIPVYGHIITGNICIDLVKISCNSL